MGYQALLFCPDEKTARAVTQVLTELDFKVDLCNEPFAAVKKLMGAHFDAVVVDCDNEQNATLLFKSARNSTSNQASLAVAVVEGQAGVAKAFRIGSNLVLTKPINIEQAKGTLRVARGLLRKGDPGKPGAGPSKPAPSTASPSGASASKDSQAALAPAASPAELTGPASKPLVPATAASGLSQDAIPASKPAAPPAAVLHSGAAAAPAREILEIPPVEASPVSAPSEDDNILESSDSAKPGMSAGAVKEQTPAFTFGGANLPAKSGTGKKIVLGIAAAAIVGAGLYFGWTYYQQHKNEPVSNPPATTLETPSAPKSSSFAPAATHPAAKPEPQPVAAETTPATSAIEKADRTSEEDIPSKSASKPAKHAASAVNEPAPAPKPAAPLVVKGGATPKAGGKSASEPQAPSVLGIASADSTGPLPDLGAPTEAPRPLLQRLNVSQGVSQGLLIKKVAPVYPANALRMRIEGAVQLQATISKDGDITHVQVLSGDKQLAGAAMDAVKRWKYKPYLLNGEPVEIQTQITISFKLPH